MNRMELIRFALQLTDQATADLLLSENPRRVLAGESLIYPERTTPLRAGLIARLRGRSN